MTPPPQIEPLNELEQRLVDVAKNAYQSSWQCGLETRIEDIWRCFPESLRLTALSELLLLDFRLRRAAGTTLSLDDYMQRFPEQAAMIAELFVPEGDSESTPSGRTPIVETAASVETFVAARDCKAAEVTAGGAGMPVPEQFGRYWIERELGRGGMGAVYLAHDGQLDRKVALKIPIFQEDDDRAEAVERFYREARSMATVQHANLCPVFDVGQFEQWHFLTMAFIDGQSLAGKLKEVGSLPVIQAVTLLKTVALKKRKSVSMAPSWRKPKPRICGPWNG